MRSLMYSIWKKVFWSKPVTDRDIVIVIGVWCIQFLADGSIGLVQLFIAKPDTLSFSQWAIIVVLFLGELLLLYRLYVYRSTKIAILFLVLITINLVRAMLELTKHFGLGSLGGIAIHLYWLWGHYRVVLATKANLVRLRKHTHS